MEGKQERCRERHRRCRRGRQWQTGGRQQQGMQKHGMQKQGTQEQGEHGPTVRVVTGTGTEGWQAEVSVDNQVDVSVAPLQLPLLEPRQVDVPVNVTVSLPLGDRVEVSDDVQRELSSVVELSGQLQSVVVDVFLRSGASPLIRYLLSRAPAGTGAPSNRYHVPLCMWVHAPRPILMDAGARRCPAVRPGPLSR